MIRFPIKIITYLLVSFALVIPPSTAFAQQQGKNDTINIGIFPRHSATDTVQMFSPMVDYLSDQLGHKFRLVISRDFQSFWKALSQGKYDIVHFNQYHYVKSKHEFGYHVILVNEEFGSAKIAGSIIVRKDSGITRLQDLRGKKIVFGGGPKAMQSYIIARYLLQKAGLTEKDYRHEFTKNPPNAILAPYFKSADAGGVGDMVLQLPAITKRIDTSKMIILAHHEPLAHLPWAVKNTMPSSLVKDVKNLLSTLHRSVKGRQILKSAALTGLRTARDSDFDKHRVIIQEVLGERY